MNRHPFSTCSGQRVTYCSVIAKFRVSHFVAFSAFFTNLSRIRPQFYGGDVTFSTEK